MNKNSTKLGDICKYLTSGIVTLTEKTVFKEKKDDRHKKFLRGDNIQRYLINFDNEYISSI